MSSDDDTRVLNMRINNKDFLKGTGDSLKAIDRLNKGIDGAGKGRGMQDMGKNIDTVKTKFGALQVAGVTALANITNRAVNAGINLAKSFTMAPIIEGFREYEKLLTSTQTIAANTGLTGKKGLDRVNESLDNLNTYSDQTIYNFGQMADSIGKFTAAAGKGSLKKSVDAIKGMSNSAALAGSDVNQLNTAMYQMSQAMATGTIKLMDWNSLANAGMGGDNMQNTLKLTAKTFDGLGPKMEAAIKNNGSFRESLREGWLTADVFTKAMKVMGGVTYDTSTSVEKLTKMGYKPAAIEAIKMGKSVAYSVKQLQKMGYSKEAAQQLNKISQSAIESATKIKTFTQLIDVVKESIGSGWAKIFRGLFGDLNEAGALWTKVGNSITGVIDRMFGSLSTVLDQWRSLGGYTKLWGGIGNIFKSIGNLLRPIVVLFQALLPSSNSAGKGLYNLTDGFYRFSVWLEKATSGTSMLTPLMEALGTVIGFLFKGVGLLVESWIGLVKIFAPIGSAVMGLLSALGELGLKLLGMVGLGDSIGGLFDGFTSVRADILTPIVDTIVSMINALTKLVETGDFSGFKDQFKGAFSNLIDLKDLFNQGKEAAANILDGLREGWASGSIQSDVKNFVDRFLNFFKDLLGIHSPSTVFEEYGKNIVEGLVNGIKDFAGFIVGAMKAIGGYIMDGLKGLDKYDLANIFSVIFGGAVFVTIWKFTRALSETMTTFKGFAESIMGEDGLFGEATNTMKAMQQGIKAKALLNIALAIGVLAVSLWVLSKIPYSRLITGGLAIAVMLQMLALTMETMAKNAAKTKTAVASIAAMSTAMVLLSVSILLLSAAVLAFGMIPTDVLIKGGIAVAVALGLLTAASLALGKASPWMAVAAAGIFVVSSALLVFATALAAFAGVFKLFASMDMNTLTTGLGRVAFTLIALGLALIPLSLLSPTIIVASAALLVLSVALGALLPIIALFNTMSWEGLAGGVGKIALTVVALGVAALIAAPGIALLGVGTLALGAGLLAAGIGMSLLGAGLAVAAAAGVSAAAVLISAFEGFLAILPIMGVQLVAALASILGAIAQKSPEIIDSLVKIISEFLRGIRELIPEFVETGIAFLEGLLQGLVGRSVAFFEAGVNLINGFLLVVAENMPQFMESGRKIITSFIEGIGGNATAFAVSAAVTILQFLHALNQTIQTYAPQITQAAIGIGKSLVVGVAKGLLPEPIFNAISILVRRFIDFFKGLLGIRSPSKVFLGFGKNLVQGLANGVKGLIGLATSAISSLVGKVVGVAKTLPGKVKNALSSLGGILKSLFLSAFNLAVNAVTSGIGKLGSAIGRIPGILKGIVKSVLSAAKSIGKAIIDGIINGIKAVIGTVMDLGSSLVNGIKDGINDILNLPFDIPRIEIKIGPKSFGIGGQELIPAFAEGVTGFSGGAALVGEMGPELVTLGRGSNVITNEILTDFIKRVSTLTRVLSAMGSKRSQGGMIQYVVSAEFRGDPKKSGVQFAADIASGLVLGLKTQQSSVNSSMADMAGGLSDSFAEVLGIQSPSKVFRKHAKFVGQGFIKGLLDSVRDVRRAARKVGEEAIDAIAQTITKGQLKLEAVRGKANAYADAADTLRAKAKKTKDKKEKKRLEVRAKVLEKLGRKEARIAARQAKRVEAQNRAADRRREYQEADTEGKAEIRREDAVNAATRASALREKSIQLSKEADLIRKFDKARAKALDKQARAALKQSKKVAERSEQYAIKARKLSIEAKKQMEKEAAAESVDNTEEINKQLQLVTNADIAKAQAAFESYAKSLIEAQDAAKQDIQPSEFKFEQNNYSPEAISPADAYRNGKSLVSIMERKLTPTP